VRPAHDNLVELVGVRPYHCGKINSELIMNPFSKTNMPITVVMALIVWAWLSLFSALIAAI
jgi:hypothetical protein